MQYSLAMIGHTEIIILLLVILVVFGASRLPKLGRNLGEGIRNLKTGLKEGMKEDESLDQISSSSEKTTGDESQASEKEQEKSEV